jgi:hypothetical protein
MLLVANGCKKHVEGIADPPCPEAQFIANKIDGLP